MSIHARCPVCGEEFRRPDSLAGKREKCPECHSVLRLPMAATPSSNHQADKSKSNAPIPPAKQPAVQPVQESPTAEAQETKVAQPELTAAKPEAPVPAKPPVKQPAKRPVKQPATPVEKVQEPQSDQSEAAPPVVEEPEPEAQSPLPPEDVAESEVPAEPSPAERAPPPSDDFFDDEIFAIAEPPLINPAKSMPLDEVDEGEVFEVAEPSTAKPPEPPQLEAADYVAYAAKEIHGGRSAETIVAELIEVGMDESEAAELVEFMADTHESYRAPKGMLWLRLLGGLMLLLINVPAFLVIRSGQGSSRISPNLQYLVLAFAFIGLLLLLAGIWRLMRPPRLSERQMIAAWDARDV